ncbi:MAG: histidine phosphatase family protein [Actinomycetia bacterium]|nr:histidine phosphatase family protein [Actinomycetes bacterium]
MAVTVVFETHSWSEDNDRGIASGWNHGRLSARGRELAAELGQRRHDDGLAAVFTSDLHRAVETTEIAFGTTPLAVLHDWRLRECNYGAGNGMPAEQLHRNRTQFLTSPYPGGESWAEAIERVGWFLRDIQERFDTQRILLIGHVATRWGLQHHLDGRSIAELAVEEFDWQHGWEYTLR